MPEFSPHDDSEHKLPVGLTPQDISDLGTLQPTQSIEIASPGSVTLEESSRIVEPAPRQRFPVEVLPPIDHASHFGGSVRVIEARPTNPTTGSLADRGPAVYYAHGAGWEQEGPTVAEIAALGRNAFSFTVVGDRAADPLFAVDAPGGEGGPLRDTSKQEVAQLIRDGKVGAIIPKQQMREAATLLGLIRERSGSEVGVQPIDAIFQSQSAGCGIVAAWTDPSKFRNIVLAFPGNFEPQTGFIPGKILDDSRVRRQHQPAPEDSFTQPRTKIEAARALREQTQSPGFQEGAAGLRYASLAPLLHSMKQGDSAPGVTLVAGLDDKIFPWERYFETLISSRDVDAMVFMPGAHAIGGRKDVMAKILEQFPEMESRDEEWIGRPLRDRIFLPNGISTELAEAIYARADELDRRSVPAA